MKFIKTAKKKSNKPADTSVKYHLHRLIARRQPGRSIKRVHASDLMGAQVGEFCPRMYVLMDKVNKKPKMEFLSTAMATTYRLGHMFGDHILSTLAADAMVIGDWRCGHCNHEFAFQARPTVCPFCGHNHFRHVEMRFTSAHSGVSCGIDMLVKLGQPKLRVVELKTIKGDDFKKLAGPLAEHKWRTNLYMRCIAESGSPWASRIDLSEATVLYISKVGYGVKDDQIKKWKLRDSGFSPFKEYPVARDDTKTDKKVRLAQMVLQWRQGEAGVPAGVCPNSFCKRALGCPVVTECFSGKFPAEVFE